MFKKNQKVVRLFSIRGIETATIQKIAKVSKKECKVRLEGDEHIWYDKDSGYEIDPVIPGCSSRLVSLESDEEKMITWL